MGKIAKLIEDNKILVKRVIELEDCNDKLKYHVDKLKEDKIEEIKRLRRENERLKKEVKALEDLRSTNEEIIKLQKIVIEHGKTEEISQENKEVSLDEFTSRQQRIFQNKVNHGFNTTNIYQEARYILEETAELMRAIEKNDRENMIEELADIIIFAYGCAEVARLGDLDTEIFKKMNINEKRVYEKNCEGDFIKTKSNN